MTRFVRKLVEYVVLITVTVAACAVMWYVSTRGEATALDGADVAKPSRVAQPKALVSVQRVEPEMVELTLTQSGKIRAWEDYSLGFEVAGRVQSLGVSAAGDPLDDGDRVEQGQILARLDDRIYAARRSEAIAQLEQAASDLARDRRLFENGRGAITEAEFTQTLTEHAVAKAQQEIAIKNLEDTVLRSPISGVINRRMVEAGESVTAHQTVFEIVQNDPLLLVVDVPESRVRELQTRMTQVRNAQQDPTAQPEDKVFRARVNLQGRDAFGRRWPAIDAEVYRIAQVADERTKLFEVEVRIDNAEGLLRPGMVATAEIVTDRLRAYRVPDLAVMFRNDQAHLYGLHSRDAPVEAMFWQVGETTLHAAQRLELKQWVEQGETIIIPADQVELDAVVTRGQQRLTDGQMVRVVNPEQLTPGQSPAAVQTAAASESVDER